ACRIARRRAAPRCLEARRSTGSRPLHEVPQQAKSGRRRFLGMKLHAENSPVLRCSRERTAVFGARDLTVDIDCSVRIDEVEIGAALEKGTARKLHAIPS